jgi:hypothetical protein
MLSTIASTKSYADMRVVDHLLEALFSTLDPQVEHRGGHSLDRKLEVGTGAGRGGRRRRAKNDALAGPRGTC